MDISSGLISFHFEKQLLSELERCKVVELPDGEIIVGAGKPIQAIPIVLEGSIRVIRSDESGKELLLYDISPGESCILSITTVLNHSPVNTYSLSAITEGKTKLIIVDGRRVVEWYNTFKSWREYISKLYNERLLELFNIVDAVAFKNVDLRLKQRLLTRMNKETNLVEATHQDLANEIGSAREVISRLLKKMEKDGHIKILRSKIKVIDEKWIKN